MHDDEPPPEPIRPGLRPVRLVLVVLAALLLIFHASDWYAAQVSLPRFCRDTELALERLAVVVNANGAVRDEVRREYLVAAKLAFLVPPAADEAHEAYLQRVRRRLDQQCR